MHKGKLVVALGSVVALATMGLGTTASASSPTSNSGATGSTSAASAPHAVASSGVSADPMKQFAKPNKKYKKATCLADESGADFTTTTTLALQGKKCKNFSVDFSTTMERRTVPNGGWASWNVPPFVESATPRVFFTGGADTVDLTFSKATKKAGTEIEPDEFTPNHTIEATFHTSSGDVVIEKSVSGQGGALLFALKANKGDTISGITIRDTHEAGTLFDFSIAKIRAQR
jgi:hypothetical protein